MIYWYKEHYMEIILWIDAHECEACGWEYLAVMGPAYGQSKDYVIKCLHCKEEGETVITHERV